MRILSVSPRVPSYQVAGSQRRMAGILDRLEERHEVVQFCQPRLEARSVPGASRERINRGLAGALVCEVGERAWTSAPVLSGAALRVSPRRPLRELLRWADVTIVDFPWQVGRCERLAPGAPLVLSAHNVEVDKFASFADAAGARVTRGPWLRYVARKERTAVARAAGVVAVSEHDRRRLVELYRADPARCVVAPTGVDLEAVAPADRERRAAARRRLGLDGARPVVLFSGADVTPNRRGLDWVMELARRTDRFTFLVVGTVGRGARGQGNVVVTGHVEEFEPCLQAADLSVCPIEFGGGTKVKLIEALAAGLPSVAFAQSIHGLGVRDGEQVLVAERSVESLLTALERLATDRALAARLAVAARLHAVEHHDWRPIASRVERLLVEVAAGGDSAPKAPEPVVGADDDARPRSHPA
jgi:glycosyltransferase involved in cell wall biosynthesis